MIFSKLRKSYRRFRQRNIHLNRPKVIAVDVLVQGSILLIFGALIGLLVLSV